MAKTKQCEDHLMGLQNHATQLRLTEQPTTNCEGEEILSHFQIYDGTYRYLESLNNTPHSCTVPPM
jgi:hypothetical protein